MLGQIDLRGNWFVMEYMGHVVAYFHAHSWFYCQCAAVNFQGGPLAIMPAP